MENRNENILYRTVWCITGMHIFAFVHFVTCTVLRSGVYQLVVCFAGSLYEIENVDFPIPFHCLEDTQAFPELLLNLSKIPAWKMGGGREGS